MSTKVKALRLKPIATVRSDFPCTNAIEIMREKGFDQLPVLSPTGTGRKLVGLVTLGNVLSRMTHGRITPASPVGDVMFDFTKITEIVTDPRDLRPAGSRAGAEPGETDTLRPQAKDRKFIEITAETPLGVLNRFFEWNSAAIVTERDERGTMKPVAVATKVDLLTWMLNQNKNGA
jgi:cystathionine beta-synthase